MITVEFRDGRARVEADGETGDICEEAARIVNALYVGLTKMDYMAGKYFEYKTRLDDSVWELPDASKVSAFEHVKMPIFGAEKPEGHYD